MSDSPPMAPELSVLTPSFGRAAILLRKLEALAEDLARPVLEVVVVDNACPDGVGDLIAGRRWPFEVRVLRCAERVSARSARLAAARVARGRWLWLSDDDCIPHGGAAARHLARQRVGTCVGVGSVRFVSGDGTVLATRPAVRPGAVQVTGVNTVVERASWLEVAERLPELPRRYGGEDTLLGLALEDAGLSVAPVVDAWVDHVGPIPAFGGDPVKGFDAGFNAAVIASAYPRAAWQLGVNRLQLGLKSLMLGVPLGPVTRLFVPRLAAFEGAYLAGARAGRAVPPPAGLRRPVFANEEERP
jgi:glycosyltransferase involved in cell wall biosynthesis